MRVGQERSGWVGMSMGGVVGAGRCGSRCDGMGLGGGHAPLQAPGILCIENHMYKHTRACSVVTQCGRHVFLYVNHVWSLS